MDETKRQMTKIAREVNKLVIRTMKETGIGSGEIDLIHTVRLNPGISQKEIAQLLNMDKGAVARRVANLEQKGFLERQVKETDKRSQLLFATAKADSLKTSKASVETAFYEWLQEGMTKEEMQGFLPVLNRLYEKSKMESRNGFPNVIHKLNGENQS